MVVEVTGEVKDVLNDNTRNDYLMQEANWVRVLQNFFMIFVVLETN